MAWKDPIHLNCGSVVLILARNWNGPKLLPQTVFRAFVSSCSVYFIPFCLLTKCQCYHHAFFCADGPVLLFIQSFWCPREAGSQSWILGRQKGCLCGHFPDDFSWERTQVSKQKDRASPLHPWEDACGNCKDRNIEMLLFSETLRYFLEDHFFRKCLIYLILWTQMTISPTDKGCPSVYMFLLLVDE